MAVHHLVLQQFSLLKPLTSEQIQHLSPQARLQDFAKREMVLPKNSPPNRLGLVLEGRVQSLDFTLDGREVGLYSVGPDGFFGELALVDGQPQAEHFVAIEKSQVIWLPAPDIRPLLFAHPALAEALAQRLALRVRHQLSQRQVLSVANPLQRICAQLQILVGNQNGQQWVVRAPTHQELAIMVNLTRETVTRTFQVLQAQGVLQRDGDALKIDAQRLTQLASGERKPE